MMKLLALAGVLVATAAVAQPAPPAPPPDNRLCEAAENELAGLVFTFKNSELRVQLLSEQLTMLRSQYAQAQAELARLRKPPEPAKE